MTLSKKGKKLPPRRNTSAFAHLDRDNKTDPLGMYTGVPTVDGYTQDGTYLGQVRDAQEKPIQDVDDL